jgi:hypothetical protein
MKVTIDYNGTLREHFSGDWDVKFVYDNYTVSTGVTADNGLNAIEYAEDRLPREILDTEPEEVIATLCGVYGGLPGDGS